MSTNESDWPLKCNDRELVIFNPSQILWREGAVGGIHSLNDAKVSTSTRTAEEPWRGLTGLQADFLLSLEPCNLILERKKWMTTSKVLKAKRLFSFAIVSSKPLLFCFIFHTFPDHIGKCVSYKNAQCSSAEVWSEWKYVFLTLLYHILNHKNYIWIIFYVFL